MTDTEIDSGYADLETATRLVAGLHSGPSCVEASALLVEVAEALGYDVQARAVSLFAHNYTPAGSVATGDRGRGFGENFLFRRAGGAIVAGDFEGGSPFQRHAGHMVVVSERHSLLMDPTFAQFEALGPQAVALFAAEAPMRSGTYWQVADEHFFARYFAADEYMDRDFDAARAQARPRVEKIVGFIQSS